MCLKFFNILYSVFSINITLLLYLIIRAKIASLTVATTKLGRNARSTRLLASRAGRAQNQ